MFAAVAVGTIIVFLVYYVFWRRSPFDDIPGPKGFPIIGHALLLDKKTPHVSIHQFHKQYGPIVKLSLFGERLVFVSSLDYIYDVLVKRGNEFGNRISSFRYREVSYGKKGVLSGDIHSQLKKERKIMHTYLKQYGVGIKRIEEITMSATNDMIERIRSSNGQPVSMHEMLVRCVTDIILVMLRGSTLYDKQNNDAILKSILDVNQGLSFSMSGYLLDCFPVLRYLRNYSYDKIQASRKFKDTVIVDWLKSEACDGFIHYLQNLPDELDWESKKQVVFDFMGAGIYTTSTSLTFLLNILAHYHQIQEKLRSEVIDTIGLTEAPTVQDRERMPFHQAVILELGRFVSLANQGVAHVTACNVSLGPYVLPEGMTVITNLWSLHHDEKLWDAPFEFRPERFLDSDGCLVRADHPNRKNLMPFGAGVRVCVGEILALTRMFLILARLMQNFVIKPETTLEEQLAIDPRLMESTVAILPPVYKICLKPWD